MKERGLVVRNWLGAELDIGNLPREGSDL